MICGFSFFGCKNLYSSFLFICYFMPPSFFLLLSLAFLSFQPFSFSLSYFFLALPLRFLFPLPSPSSLLILLFCLEISHMFLEANLHTWAWWLSSLKLSQWTLPRLCGPQKHPLATPTYPLLLTWSLPVSHPISSPYVLGSEFFLLTLHCAECKLSHYWIFFLCVSILLTQGSRAKGSSAFTAKETECRSPEYTSMVSVQDHPPV